MRYRGTMLAIGLAAALGGCGANEAGTNDAAPAVAAPQAPLDANGVAGQLRKAGLPVTSVTVVTEDTDDNQLLGRPNQYTSKVFFYDGRHPKVGSGDEGESTIEVFANAEDAKARHDYVAAMTKAMSSLTQYQYLQGPVLVRLDKALKPSEAAEYGKALNSVR